jgi:hypothetical protein
MAPAAAKQGTLGRTEAHVASVAAKQGTSVAPIAAVVLAVGPIHRIVVLSVRGQARWVCPNQAFSRARIPCHNRALPRCNLARGLASSALTLLYLPHLYSLLINITIDQIKISCP